MKKKIFTLVFVPYIILGICFIYLLGREHNMIDVMHYFGKCLVYMLPLYFLLIYFVFKEKKTIIKQIESNKEKKNHNLLNIFYVFLFGVPLFLINHFSKISRKEK